MKNISIINKIMLGLVLIIAFITIQLWKLDGFNLLWFLVFIGGLAGFALIGYIIYKFTINKRIKKWWRYPETYCTLVYYKHIVWGKFIIIVFKSDKEPSFFKLYVWKNNETGKYRLDWWKQYPASGWKNPRNSDDIKLWLDGWDLDTIKNLFTKVKDWFGSFDLGYRFRRFFESIGEFFGNIWEWIPESKRWLYFVLPIVLLGIGFIIAKQKPEIDLNDYDLAGICYVPGNPETIWECYYVPSSFDENKKGAYKILIKDAHTGKEIKTMKKSFDEAGHSFEIMYCNNMVWIIGYDSDNPPVIDAYNPATFDKILDIEEIKKQYPELQSGIVDGSFLYEPKVYDNNLSLFRNIPNYKIIEIVGADGNKRFYNIDKAELYSNEDELYWNYNISANKLPEVSGDFIYYLVYRDDKTISYLYRWKPENKNAYINNTDPHQIDSLLNNKFIHIELEKSNYYEAFEQAKIVFQDSVLIGVIHKKHINGKTTHFITCLNQNGGVIGDIDFSKFNSYNLQSCDELFISAYRNYNVISFRVEGLGMVSLDTINKNVQYYDDYQSHPFILVETSNPNEKQLYVSNTSCSDLHNIILESDSKLFLQLIENGNIKLLLPEKVLLYPNILYQDKSIAVIYFYKLKPNGRYEFELLCIDTQGNILYNVPVAQLPNYDKIKEEINAYQGTGFLEDNLCATIFGNSLVIIFERLGAISIDLKTGKVLWKYEVNK